MRRTCRACAEEGDVLPNEQTDQPRCVVGPGTSPVGDVSRETPVLPVGKIKMSHSVPEDTIGWRMAEAARRTRLAMAARLDTRCADMVPERAFRRRHRRHR